MPPAGATPRAPEYSTAEAGNPFVDGWYADPDVAIHWTKHPNVLTVANVSWARRAVWEPAPVARNGRYYLYFAANDIQGDSELGGIGVAVADRPEGPYRDAIGKPLIGRFFNGAQPIDQDVFIDTDGQAYMYYGGWGHSNVVKLNADMTSLGTFADGTTYKEITPENYVEGPQMFKRGGKYYLMWSEGGWTGPDYAVSYAMSDSPTGPFHRISRVLSQDPAVACHHAGQGQLRGPQRDRLADLRRLVVGVERRSLTSRRARVLRRSFSRKAQPWRPPTR